MDQLSISDLLAATGGASAGNLKHDDRFDGVGIDSRTIRPGQVFWAVRGQKLDGHNFVNQARERGAVASVIAAGRESDCAGPAIVVPDTLDALWRFARRHRDRQETLIVGVTGSVGKTTTRRMLFDVLSAGFPGIQSPRNFNNQFGVPLSVLQINANHEFAVLELAASHVGEIRQLANVAAPEVGVITAIGPAHLEGFGSEDNIRKGKGELLASLPSNGFAVLNGDDPQVRSLATGAPCRVLLTGTSADCDFQATDVSVSPTNVSFSVHGAEYSLPALGRHHLTSALTAVAVATEIGMDTDQINSGFAGFQPTDGRSSLQTIGEWSVIDDTYNANPRSMQAAVELLDDCFSGQRRILIAGDMLELGEQAQQLHEQFGHVAGASGIDHLLVFGRYADDVAGGARSAGMPANRICRANDMDTLLAILDCWLAPNAAVLVKGSRGLRMETVVEWLRNHPAALDASSNGTSSGGLNAAA